MRLYPQIPSQRARTLVADLVVLALLALFAWLGVKVHGTVDELAVLGRGVADAGNAVEGGFERAAEAVDAVPVVGDDLGEALRGAGAGTGGNVAEFGREGEERVHRAATLLGIVTFVVSAILVLLHAMPARIDLVRRLTAADRVLSRRHTDDELRLVAMRAAFSLPYGELVRHTRDPFGDLAAGRHEALVAAAYASEGLRARR